MRPGAMTNSDRSDEVNLKPAESQPPVSGVATGPSPQVPTGRAWQQPVDRAVDARLVCVITRFGLRNPLYLIPVYLDYRRVVGAARRAATPGFIRAAFLVENLTTCYSLSLWESRRAIAHFGTNVPSHVQAARRAFGRVRFDRERGPEVWSTKWHLESVSNTASWGTPDFGHLLADLPAARS